MGVYMKYSSDDQSVLSVTSGVFSGVCLLFRL